MAAAFFNALADPECARAVSAGTHPAERIHGEVLEVMGEAGIDLSGGTPRSMATAVVEGVDILVTMGCGVACPTLPGAELLEWSFDDPSGESVAAVRRIRDRIRDRVLCLLEERNWGVTRKKPS